MTARKALLALLAAIPAFTTAASAAKGPTVYTVSKITVTADADNAVAAKEKALAQAQQIALRALMSRMTPWEAHAKLPQLTNEIVGLEFSRLSGVLRDSDACLLAIPARGCLDHILYLRRAPAAADDIDDIKKFRLRRPGRWQNARYRIRFRRQLPYECQSS